MRGRLRHLFPPSGAAYELFDCAVLLFALGFVGYVLTPPTAPVRGALAFDVESNPVVWGAGLTLAALAGVVCSYRDRWLRAGYVIVVVACAFWSASFLLAALFLGAETRTVVSAVLYAWIARRLLREVWRLRGDDAA